MTIEVVPKKTTLKEIKDGEVFEYKFEGDTCYCIKVSNTFTDYNVVSLVNGTLFQLPNAQNVTPVKARLVVEE